MELITKLKELGKIACINFDIEIVAMNAIEDGVEVFARAWTKDGKQVGFGIDGSVDVERFIIHRERKAYRNPNGEIVFDGIRALLIDLDHTICVVPKRGPENIVRGKIGNTTSTFYPVAGANSPCDGRVIFGTSNVSWATAHDAADGTSASVTDSIEGSIINILCDTTSNQYDQLIRSFYNFDTSAIPDTDVISSATFSVYGAGSPTNQLDQNINVVGATPAGTNTLVVGDFDQYQTTRFASDLDGGSWSTAGYNDFAFNASGIAAISKTGVSSFALMLSSDIDDTEPTWVSANQANFGGYYADQALTTNDPKLVVVHAAAATGYKNLLLMGVG